MEKYSFPTFRMKQLDIQYLCNAKIVITWVVNVHCQFNKQRLTPEILLNSYSVEVQILQMCKLCNKSKRKHVIRVYFL